MFAFDNVHYYSFIKNVLQFALGATLAYALFASLPDAITLFSALGFLFAYHSVYYMNDIVDMDADAKDPIKRRIKPLARDRMKLKGYVLKMFLFMLVGLALISFNTHVMFKLVVFAALISNLLHSAGLKKTPLSGVNMLVMEWLKFSAGYLAFIPAIPLNPAMFLLVVAGAYTFAYGVYKNISAGFKEGIITRWHDTFVGALALIIPSLWLLYVGSSLFMALLLGLLSTLPIILSYPFLSPHNRLRIGGALTIIPYLAVMAGLLLFCRMW